jgi:hypothetical protein
MRIVQLLLVLLSLGVISFFIFASAKIQQQSANFVENSGSNSFSIEENYWPANQKYISSGSNFRVIPTGRGQFEIILFNGKHEDVNIQIYDVIGNLLIQETSDQSQIRRKYDLSQTKSRLFVIKVENSSQARIRKVTTG